MASLARRGRRKEEDGESVFVSMTDLSVSFLFILLILLAFFATQFHSEQTVPLEVHQAEITKRDRTIREVEAERDTANAEVQKLKLQINQLQNEAIQRDLRIENLEVEIRRLIAIHQLEISKRDRTIRNVKTERDIAKTENQTLNVQVNQLRQEIVQYKQRFDTLEATIRKLKVKIMALEVIIEKLRRMTTDPLARYLQDATKQRNHLLVEIKKRIEENAGIKVTIDQDNGLIRLSADELFASGQWRVVGQEKSTVHQIAVAIARALMDVLPPYTFGPDSRFDHTANPAGALIETVQIEGHTDAVPVSGRGELLDNFDLSARRGAEMFRVMIDQEDGLLKHFQNLRGMPVLSFSGYGEMRPLERQPGMNDVDYNRQNRRIDLRVILQTPQNMEEVQRIRDRLARSPNSAIRDD